MMGRTWASFRSIALLPWCLHGRGPVPVPESLPRDFRPGILKWKLTDQAENIEEDLRSVLENGIAGTEFFFFTSRSG